MEYEIIKKERINTYDLLSAITESESIEKIVIVVSRKNYIAVSFKIGDHIFEEMIKDDKHLQQYFIENGYIKEKLPECQFDTFYKSVKKARDIVEKIKNDKYEDKKQSKNTIRLKCKCGAEIVVKNVNVKEFMAISDEFNSFHSKRCYGVNPVDMKPIKCESLQKKDKKSLDKSNENTKDIFECYSEYLNNKTILGEYTKKLNMEFNPENTTINIKLLCELIEEKINEEIQKNKSSNWEGTGNGMSGS